MTTGSDGPPLTRVGSQRPVRLGVAVATTLLAAAVGIALVERMPTDSRPRPSVAVGVASATPAPTTLAATPTASPDVSAAPGPTNARSPTPAPSPTDPPSALDRGNGWPPRPNPDSAAHFQLRLLSYQVVIDELRLHASDDEAAGRLAVPPTTWHVPAWLQLRWRDGTDDDQGGQQLAMVPLSLSASDEAGLPISLGAGQARLPRPLRGTRHWDYQVTLERAHDYSRLDEWIAVVRLVAADEPRARPAAQSAPLILLTSAPGHARRATRTHGHSWVAGR